jgi:integrase
VRAGERPLRAGESFRPRPGATEQVHETDCAKGLPLSASKVHQIHAILSGSLQQAVRWGWLTHNPARLATPPSVKRGRSAKVVPPAVTDAIRLLTEAQGSDPELGLFLRLASVLGSRRGELCSLRWTDLDFEHGEALVDSGVIYVPGQPLIDKDTKESDKRRVAVDPATMQMAEDHRRRAERIAVEFGITLPVDAYVFSHEPDGSKPIRPDGVSHRFSKLRDRLGLTCRLHDLRHFMVTQLLSAGVDLRTVAGRAGHADGGAMTLSVYGHFQRAKDREAAVLISGFLAGQCDPPFVEHG